MPKGLSRPCCRTKGVTRRDATRTRCGRSTLCVLVSELMSIFPNHSLLHLEFHFLLLPHMMTEPSSLHAVVASVKYLRQTEKEERP